MILLQGAAEVVPHGAVRSAQGRRPAGLRARPRSGGQGHAVSPCRRRYQRPSGVRCRGRAAAGFRQAAGIRVLAASCSRRCRICVPRAVRAGALCIFLCMTGPRGVPRRRLGSVDLPSCPVCPRGVGVPCVFSCCARVRERARRWLDSQCWRWMAARARSRRAPRLLALACRRCVGRHAEMGADPGLSEQSAAQRPARRGARHRRNRAAGAVGLSPARQPVRLRRRAISRHADQDRHRQPADLLPARPAIVGVQSYGGTITQTAAQRIRDRQPDAAGRSNWSRPRARRCG